MSAGDTLYLKIGKNIVVTDRRVTLGDVAKMECTDQAALRQIKQKKLYSFRAEDEQKKKNTLVVFSVLKVIELIHEDYPNLDISNEGESDFIVEYVKSPGKTGVDELSEDSDLMYTDFLWGCFYDHGI